MRRQLRVTRSRGIDKEDYVPTLSSPASAPRAREG
jgi:hypothetical protein